MASEPDATKRRVELICKHSKDEERPAPLILRPQVVELDVKDRYGDPITSLVLDVDLTPDELAVQRETKAGATQRVIVGRTGLKRTNVQRIQRKLKALGLLE